MKAAVLILVLLFLGLAVTTGPKPGLNAGFIPVGFDAESSESAKTYGLGTSDSKPIDRDADRSQTDPQQIDLDSETSYSD